MQTTYHSSINESCFDRPGRPHWLHPNTQTPRRLWFCFKDCTELVKGTQRPEILQTASVGNCRWYFRGGKDVVCLSFFDVFSKQGIWIKCTLLRMFEKYSWTWKQARKGKDRFETTLHGFGSGYMINCDNYAQNPLPLGIHLDSDKSN